MLLSDCTKTKLPDLAPFILGQEVLNNECVVPPTITDQDVSVWLDLYASSSTVRTAVENCEKVSDFLKICPAFKKEVDKDKIVDAFYSLKLGMTADVPMHIMYYVQKALQLYPVPNNVPLVLPKKILISALSPQFMNGHTLYDVISYYCADYEPFEKGKYVITHNDYLEVYDATRNLVRTAELDTPLNSTNEYVVRELDLHIHKRRLVNSYGFNTNTC